MNCTMMHESTNIKIPKFWRNVPHLSSMYDDNGGRRFFPSVDTYLLYYYNVGFSSFSGSVILISFWRTQI